MDNRSRLSMKLDTLQRLVMCHTLSSVLPLYIINEYPKSGGTWLAQMIGEYLELPFPRNENPKLESCIMHGHMMPGPLMTNVFCLFRDGRDVMVSYYFHMLFQNDKNPPRMVERARGDLQFADYDDVRKNLPEFIRYNFNRRRKSLNPNQFTWDQFVNAWSNKNVCKIKYEDMVVNGVETLSRAIAEVTGKQVDRKKIARIVNKYSFENQTKRKPGQEDSTSFLRKGVPGDWKEKFTRESAEIFDKYAGNELIAIGYEKDRSWINTVDN